MYFHLYGCCLPRQSLPPQSLGQWADSKFGSGCWVYDWSQFSSLKTLPYAAEFTSTPDRTSTLRLLGSLPLHPLSQQATVTPAVVLADGCLAYDFAMQNRLYEANSAFSYVRLIPARCGLLSAQVHTFGSAGATRPMV